MGYDKNPYGKPVFDDKYDFPQDSQAAVDYADEFANTRRGTSSERQSLPSAKQRPGMLWSETDANGGVFRTDGAGQWRDITRAKFATYAYTRASAPDGMISDGTLAALAGETTDSNFIALKTGASATLDSGVYAITFTVAGSVAFGGRTFLEIEGGGRVVRNGIASGEDKGSVSGNLMIPTSGTVAFRVYKTSGGANLSGYITIWKAG